MNIRQSDNDVEELDVLQVARLNEDELTAFNSVQNDEVAIKMVMDSAVKTAHGMAKEIVERRNEFWTNLIMKHNLMPNGKYMIDTRNGSVMMHKE